MAYTLMKGLAWFLLALSLGVTIGWLLRSVVAGRQLRRARADPADASDVERLRSRVIELEAVVVEQASANEKSSSGSNGAGSKADSDVASRDVP